MLSSIQAGGWQWDWHFPCQFGVQNIIAHTQLSVLMAINFNLTKRDRKERERVEWGQNVTKTRIVAGPNGQ